MATRPLRKSDARVVRLPTSLRSVDSRREPAEAPELWLGAHVVSADATLESLATRGQKYTPRVSLVPPDGLLLEVKGSLHLFNGVDGLLDSFREDCRVLGVEAVTALAPTPLAAMVAARVGEPFVVTNKAQLVGRLTSMPLAPLRWPEDVVERLARMGVRTIGQTLRLPRAGFARRFGPAHLAELDRLTGRNADLRQHFQPRERFRRRRELTYEMENNTTILAALAPMLTDLGRFLESRQVGITELECRLRHRHVPSSVCVLSLAGPLANVPRLTELLGERLNALVLPEPVRSLELRSGLPVVRELSSNPLWQPGEYGGGAAGSESSQLVERLRARLGHEAVYGLQMLQGHRPERAWRMCEPAVAVGANGGARRSGTLRTSRDVRADERAAATRVARQPGAGSNKRGRSLPSTATPWPAFRRPLWLLPTPQQLEEIDGVPRRRGTLRFFGDVERIETGWWDGGEIGRDYYTVFDIHGVQLWIFRERANPHRWFLHGVFG
ncbi:MAG: DNA polymerase Y family protein [Proteobacteria bacterium]|nr:DNA polymerase Y family protein [Pseudomonadota bacterium]